MPSLGLGTWDLRGDACHEAVEKALMMGYRHIDTAEMYGNEEAIGKAIAHSGIPREELFVTTKVWTNHHEAKDFRKAADDSLRRLGLSHVDLLLIHWPNPAVPLKETIGALCQVAEEGKTLAIGVSNFSVGLFRQASALATFPIACNQIAFSLETQGGGREFLAALKADTSGLSGVKAGLDPGTSDLVPILCAYTPLGRGSFLGRPELAELAKKRGKTPAQVALRWLLQQGKVSVIPKARGEKHLRENMGIFDFELDPADLQRLGRFQAD